MKLIIESAISDLQTGGNNSTIDAIAKYLTAALTLNITDGVEQELLATVYGIEQLEALGKKAIENGLFAMQMVRTQVVQQVHTQHYILMMQQFAMP